MSASKSKLKNENGLSMIEVLVALAIFASTVVLALSSLQLQLNRQHKIEIRHLAGHLSNNFATQLQLSNNSWPNSSQTFQQNYAGKTWTVKLSPQGSPLSHWKSLNVEVLLEGVLLATQTIYSKAAINSRQDNLSVQSNYTQPSRNLGAGR
ncbi:type II secretion system minor pseudopilin GspI [uncultured Pseudoteredinibacter sp.]|uniref:type II secretion system minor pseudopilin GspI n=1 Tax=uncultured Pseudoteredinibacter sp. TaxID=1641701 RepID=UPI00262A44C1|nr:type II secretion system minor pseudopilin GspI [uncultured Pseudoteredinibacter sp.]